jgi:fibronectin type 3 domain-containing protein
VYLIAVSGTGVQPVSRSVDLTWDSSAGAVGYKVYRGTISGGPYTVLIASRVTTTTYTDRNVQSRQTYYYVVTSVASDGIGSAFSAQVSVTIP